MQKSKNCDYYIGLDMGDASVGWAVTDTNYNILKFNGKALWGIRLFDSANTAASTRVFRSGRRRIDRTTWRLKMLQELFAEEIAKVDPGFFMRLEDSRLHLDDKRDKAVYNLFVDKNYTDKDFISNILQCIICVMHWQRRRYRLMCAYFILLCSILLSIVDIFCLIILMLPK